MTNGTRSVALSMLAIGFLAGCESSAPTTPSLPPPAGMVELTTNRPNGAMLVVNPCVDEEGNRDSCTRDLQMTISVVLNRDVDRAIVNVQFYTATGRLCAAGNTAVVPLTAGTAAKLTASSVYVFLQVSPECGLPLQTTRMVAQLLQERVSPSVLLTQEFSNAYTFTNP